MKTLILTRRSQARTLLIAACLALPFAPACEDDSLTDGHVEQMADDAEDLAEDAADGIEDAADQAAEAVEEATEDLDDGKSGG